MSEQTKNSEIKPYRRSCSTINERILVQMTKLVGLCEDEGYNNATLKSSRNIISELRESMNVRRVVDGMVEYKHEEPK